MSDYAQPVHGVPAFLSELDICVAVAVATCKAANWGYTLKVWQKLVCHLYFVLSAIR